MKLISKVLAEKYGIAANRIDLLSDHGEGKTYKVETQNAFFVLKQIPSFSDHPEKEGPLTQYLIENGIKVPRMHKTTDDGSWVATDEKGIRYQLLDFVDGTVRDINTAPDWFLQESAAMLGRIHSVLRDYQPLPAIFSSGFFSKEMILLAEKSYEDTLRKAKRAKDSEVERDIEARLGAVQTLSDMPIEYDRLTIGNSHGDYWIGQIIEQDHKLCVIDWTDAATVPLCLEIIMSYTYAQPKCADGTIDAEGLAEYIRAYSKHNQLQPYDLEAMPYVYAYWIGVLNFYEPYPGLPDEYLRIAKLCTRLLEWLIKNGRDLSVALSNAFE